MSHITHPTENSNKAVTKFCPPEGTDLIQALASDRVNQVIALPSSGDQSFRFFIKDPLILAAIESRPTLWYDLRQKLLKYLRPSEKTKSEEALEIEIA